MSLQCFTTVALDRPVKGTALQAAIQAVSEEYPAVDWSCLPHKGGLVEAQEFKPGRYYERAVVLVTCGDSDNAEQLAMAFQANLPLSVNGKRSRTQQLHCYLCKSPATYCDGRAHCDECDRAAIMGITMAGA